ncbi:isochorismatase family protein [candidate division GN15 bacterium]|nr:isochorismatase family protein [candidate division GN15 bacterium]
MLKPETTALVFVDIQGKLATLMYEKDRLFANLVRMARGAHALDIPIIWNEQLPDKLGETIPELKETLESLDKQPLIKKHFSACGNPDFVKTLEATGRKDVLLTGIETHICVYQSAIDLLESGYNVHLVIDATSSRLEHNYHLGVQRIKDAGAVLTSVEMCLLELQEIAEGDRFRELIKIIK